MSHEQLPEPDEFHVVAEEGAVLRARRRITAAIHRWNIPFSDAAVADVQLCASEIITNALVHAGGEGWVRTSWTGQFLQVEVADRSLCPPEVLPASGSGTTGRGLAIVESFSQGWGWAPHGVGKTVFFIVADESVLAGTARLKALVRNAQARIEQSAWPQSALASA